MAQGLYISGWKRWRRYLVVVALTVLAMVAVGWLVVSKEDEEEVAVGEVLTEVKVKALSELIEESVVTKLATLEPAVHAPLVARVGGRVSKIEAKLGQEVEAQDIVVAIDGAEEANITRVQVETAEAGLAAFDNIKRQAMASVETAIATATIAVDSARAGKRLTADQVKVARSQADLGVRQADLNLQDVLEGDGKTDALERAAHLAVDAAGLAQDQATAARNLTTRAASDGLKQAENGLQAAEIARAKLAADLSSQRVALVGQLSAAREQVRLAQVTAPVAGQVTRLNVRAGDFIRPGEIVGEVTAFEGAQMTVQVTTGVRGKLTVGQKLKMTAKGDEFTGEVTQLADGPGADSALWQVDILVVATPSVMQPGELVSVILPVGATADENVVFIPLDIITIRQDGVVVFTVDDQNIVAEHVLEVSGYSGDFVQGELELADDARVVVEGSRLLQVGQEVRVLEI